jgi:NADPH:quinone reductase-like Zn-dependent oxidoreductase
MKVLAQALRARLPLAGYPDMTDLDAIAEALYYVAPHKVELRSTSLPKLEPGYARIRTLYSGVSRGTERLVFEGRLPESEWGRMRAPGQEGEFPFPVKYGYATVGVVEKGPEDLLERPVFVLHPHQNRFVIESERLMPLPEGLPPRRAVLGANMETALNALWDSGAGPADRIVVVGGGLVGLLVAALAAAMPGTEVTVIDIVDRASAAQAMGARFAWPDDAPDEADIVFHASAHQDGLRQAIEIAGTEATLVEMSWYGDREVMLALGGPFHARRLKLISSQVGMVSPSRRPRWSHARRLSAALALLADPRFDALITEEVAFADLTEVLPRILAPKADGIATVIRYDRKG